jgi:hypothetical protein
MNMCIAAMEEIELFSVPVVENIVYTGHQGSACFTFETSSWSGKEKTGGQGYTIRTLIDDKH